MFGLRTKDARETARRLFARAHEVEEKYLRLSMADLTEQLSADLPAHMRSVTAVEVTFRYEEVSGFSFSIMALAGDPVLTIFGENGGRFAGFMLQRASSGEAWHTMVEKPAAFHVGSMANRLADSFKQQFGLANLSELRRRLSL